MKFLTSRVVRISTASLLAGVLIGLVGGAFRYLLIAADNQRTALIAWAHAWPYLGWRPSRLDLSEPVWRACGSFASRPPPPACARP